MNSARWRVCGMVVLLAPALTGCISRAIRESIGAVTGARGKVVEISPTKDLIDYKGVRVNPVTVSPGLPVRDQMPKLITENFGKFAAMHGLTPEGSPALIVSGEIIHYETGGAVDTVIGPLEEVIVRTKLIDAQTNQLLGEANLLGRSKASSSSGLKNLSEGAGKALSKWFKESGLPIPKKGEEEHKDKERDEAVMDKRE